jgi:hypothetical protein
MLDVSRETMPCSRCGKPRDREGQRYCIACHAAYMRDYHQSERAAVKQLKELRELVAESFENDEPLYRHNVSWGPLPSGIKISSASDWHCTVCGDDASTPTEIKHRPSCLLG